MKALTWHGKRDVRIDEVPDPAIEKPTDAVVRITTTAICGSDLHLYEVMGPFIEEGDVLGHEPMGIVEAVGDEVTELAPGDRVVIPFQISCGRCFMCEQGLQTQPGRRWSTPAYRTAAASPCSGSGRSATWPAASRSTAATA
jgi:threonine dehydrogenase-like Zn-dependent dehydrogenase